MKHLVSVPKPPAPHPVLCFLHGYDEAAPLAISDALTRHGPLNPANPPSVKERFLIIAPQLAAGGDVWHRYSDEVHHIVDEEAARHGGDARRRYLTGFSFGGNGVFDLAFLRADYWAALWAVDPTRVPARDPRRPVWLSFGEVARFQKLRFTLALQLKEAAEPPFGERVGFDGGEDHTGAASRAYADERIYAWLLSQAL